MPARSTRTRDSRNCKPRLTTPSAPAPPPLSIEQAKLNRFWEPTPHYYEALQTWTLRLRSPDWTPEIVWNRMCAMAPDMHALRTVLRHPPEDWDGVIWTQMYDRLKSWHGQYDALRMRLSEMTKKRG